MEKWPEGLVMTGWVEGGERRPHPSIWGPDPPTLTHTHPRTCVHTYRQYNRTIRTVTCSWSFLTIVQGPDYELKIKFISDEQAQIWTKICRLFCFFNSKFKNQAINPLQWLSSIFNQQASAAIWPPSSWTFARTVLQPSSLLTCSGGVLHSVSSRATKMYLHSQWWHHFSRLV